MDITNIVSKISLFEVSAALDQNALGDGLLYAKIYHGKWGYCPQTGDWYEFTGHYWKIDDAERYLGAVEAGPVAAYQRLYTSILDQIIEKKRSGADTRNSEVSALERHQRQITKRIERLRSSKGRRDCVEFARTQ